MYSPIFAELRFVTVLRASESEVARRALMSDWAARAPSASVPRLPETSSRMPRLAAS